MKRIHHLQDVLLGVPNIERLDRLAPALNYDRVALRRRGRACDAHSVPACMPDAVHSITLCDFSGPTLFGCCFMAYTQQQILFKYWADEQSLAAVVRAGDAVPEALLALGHSVAMSQLWASRVEGASGTIIPWPKLDASQIGSELIFVARPMDEAFLPRCPGHGGTQTVRERLAQTGLTTSCRRFFCMVRIIVVRLPLHFGSKDSSPRRAQTTFPLFAVMRSELFPRALIGQHLA